MALLVHFHFCVPQLQEVSPRACQQLVDSMYMYNVTCTMSCIYMCMCMYVFNKQTRLACMGTYPYMPVCGYVTILLDSFLLMHGYYIRYCTHCVHVAVTTVVADSNHLIHTIFHTGYIRDSTLYSCSSCFLRVGT